MQENEFEKKLQQKMDALQVQPAEEVWQKVQAHIAGKKRRRRGIVFFFLLSGLSIAGLVFMNITGMFNKEKIAAANKIKTEKQNEQEVNSSLPKYKLTEGKSTNNTSLSVAVKSNSNNNNTADNNISGRHLIKAKTKASVKTKIISPVQDEINDKEVDVAVTAPSTGEATKPADAEKNKTTFTENKNDNTTAVKNEKQIIEPVKNENKPAKKNKKEEKGNQQKWGLAITFSGGISSTGNSYLNNGLYSTDITSVPATGGATGSSYVPSHTKQGFSYIAGVQLYRNISKNSRIITGLQYQQMNTSIKTGQPVGQSSSTNSTRDNVFAYGTTKNYTSHYHFISLPVIFSTKIFSIGQRAVCFDAGINFSKLLSTDALSFNAVQGVYYKDELIFNKTQVGLYTAVKLNLAAKNKAAFFIGAEFYYSLKPLALSGMYSEAHSNFIGIRLQKNIKK